MSDELLHLAQHFNDPAYWNGNGDGYAGGGYRDFDVNQLKVNHLLTLNPQRVLDVGCAYGFIVGRLRAAGVEAYGLDVSQYAIDQASHEVRPYLNQGFAHQLPWDDNSFDVISCFGMLEHIPEDLIIPTLKEFARVAPRGVLSITLKDDPLSEQDSSHSSLLSYYEWLNRVSRYCPGYELMSDAQELWELREKRRWAVIAPTIYPLGKTGYAGIERLAVLFLKGLMDETKRRDSWELVCFCTNGSVVPRGVRRISSGPPLMDFREPNLIGTISAWGPEASCYLDFSHSKAVPWQPEVAVQMGVIWHDPLIMKPRVPPYNVVALSRWQAERFINVYHQGCLVLDPHCGDGDVLTPGDQPLEDYLVFLGKLSPDKGALEAIEACRRLRQKLVLIGPVTPGDPPDYVNRVISACDGENIIYHPQVTGPQKVDIFQKAKALFYPVNYPAGQGEAHSHKSIEAMLCGTPCILYDQGAMREVVDEGVTGFVIAGREDLPEAIKACETLDRRACREHAMERWDYRNVVRRWVPIMDDVSRGARW